MISSSLWTTGRVRKVSDLEDYCKICGKEIAETHGAVCQEPCLQKLEDTEVIRVRTLGHTEYFYHSPEGKALHNLWPNGIDSWELAPRVSMKQFDERIEKADTPGYGYESVELEETPLEEVDGVKLVDTCA